MKRALLISLFLGAALAWAQAKTVTVAGKILGASGKHPVYVALWDGTGFLEKPAQQVKLAPGTDLHFSFEVLPGRWAVSSFEDVNESGVLETGMFGPKEPHGWWKPYTAHRKPVFDDVALTVEKPIPGAEVTLK